LGGVGGVKRERRVSASSGSATVRLFNSKPVLPFRLNLLPLLPSRIMITVVELIAIFPQPTSISPLPDSHPPRTSNEYDVDQIRSNDPQGPEGSRFITSQRTYVGQADTKF